ncbi:hypothetical protein Pint_20375 [Pistacia integerrima]|uniref:Uncharacterized protein n=1 Tax=Pistacia integerrima TaxID=434235 RepID=A0ACC0XDW4_9ROSI|nr:hypothetical protein Pint_20375 [Pistacia integerrima]
MFLNSLLSLFAILLILQLPHATQGVSGLSEASKRVFSQSPPPSLVLNAPQHFESGQFTPPSPPHVVPSRRVHLKRRLLGERSPNSGWSHAYEASKRGFSQSPPPSPVLNAPQHFESGQFTPPSPPHVVPSRRIHLKRRLLGERSPNSGWSHAYEASKRGFSQSPPPSPVLNAPQHFESGQFTPPSRPHVVPSCRVHFKRRRSLLQLSLPEVAVSNCRVHFKRCNFLALKRRPPASSGSVNSGRRRFLGERRHVSGWSHIVSKRLFPESPPPPPVANARVHLKRRRSLLQLSLPEVASSNCHVHFKGCNFLAKKQRPPASNCCVHTKLRRFLGEPSPPQMASNDRVQFKHRQITSTV